MSRLLHQPHLTNQEDKSIDSTLQESGKQGVPLPIKRQYPATRLTPNIILGLQRSHGNQYVRRLIDQLGTGSSERTPSPIANGNSNAGAVLQRTLEEADEKIEHATTDAFLPDLLRERVKSLIDFGITAINNVQILNSDEFNAVLKKSFPHMQDLNGVNGFRNPVYPSISYVRETATTHTIVHEMIHQYSSLVVADELGEPINEGYTEYFTQIITGEYGQSVYERYVEMVVKLQDLITDDDAVALYFSGDISPLAKSDTLKQIHRIFKDIAIRGENREDIYTYQSIALDLCKLKKVTWFSGYEGGKSLKVFKIFEFLLSSEFEEKIKEINSLISNNGTNDANLNIDNIYNLLEQDNW